MSAASPAVWLFGALTLAASGYYAAVVAAGIRFHVDVRRRRALDPSPLPAVSILKPIRGADAQLLDNLRSHARLDYPTFELVFGVADAEDPALSVIEQLRQEFPAAAIRALVCGPAGDGNAKVAILEKLSAAAHHDVFLVDDADIRLEPHTLRGMAGELSDEVGMVTALYRARPGTTEASRLDAAWISADFSGQALIGAYLAGMSFALGAAMLFRRRDLERIGGFSAIRPYLADDYQLGVRIAALGRPIRLSGQVVETISGDAGWGEVWRRHVRWSRTIRASRPGGHAGFAVTFGVLWSLLLLASGGPAWMAAGCLLGRYAASASTASRTGAAVGWRAAPAELWAAAVWLASFASRNVNWRGRRLRLDAAGRIAGEAR